MSQVLTVMGVVAVIFIFSCSKDKRPAIKIIAPVNGQIFNAPDSIKIKADIQDSHDALFSEYLIVTKLSNTNDTIINFTDNKFVGDLYAYHLEKSFVSEAHTSYKIVVGGYGSGFSSDSVIVKTN